LGNIDVYREFGDVRSVAKIYSNILGANPQGKTLNICTGRAHSLKEVISLCTEITGHSIEIKVNPLFIRQNEVKTLVGDNTHLRTLIGELPILTLHDTLSWMFRTN
jgi:GDP-D-mannose dehydratase